MSKIQCDKADDSETIEQGQSDEYKIDIHNPKYIHTKFNAPCGDKFSKIHVVVCVHSTCEETNSRIVIDNSSILILNKNLVPTRTANYSFDQVYTPEKAEFDLYNESVKPQVDHFLNGRDSGIISRELFV